MIPDGGSLDSGDLRRLSEIHHASLPHSSLTLLGLRCTERFYMYVSKSSNEVLITVRDPGSGSIVGACVLSYSPGSLARRVLFGLGGSLAFSVVGILRHFDSSLIGRGLRIARSLLRNSPGPGFAPEVVIMLTAPGHRFRGVGSQLLSDCERDLKNQKIGTYYAKTRISETDEALGFYTKNGFKVVDQISFLDRRFHVLGKRI